MRATAPFPPARVAAAAIAAAALLASSPGLAGAAPGDLDPTFDRDGKTILSAVNSVPVAVLVQPDGKIVLAGSTADGNTGAWRLNPDGSPDRSFDRDGAAIVDFGWEEYASSAALQSDGKLVVVSDHAVARFEVDGSLDETFDPGGPDGDGKKVLPVELGQGRRSVHAVIVQRDGKIALPSTYYPNNEPGSDFTITRLRPDGSLDGTVFELADFGEWDEATAAAAAPDDTIVVVGTTTPVDGVGSVIAVARYKSDGSLDQTFAAAGKTTLGPGEPTAVLVQPDGRVLVASTSDAGDPFVTRLTHDGAPDATFGDGGTAAGGFVGERLGRGGAAALRPDGTIFITGTAANASAVAVGRLSPGGMPDTGFGLGGSATIEFGLASLAGAAALQPDGKLVVTGATLAGVSAVIGVARLLGDPPALPTGSHEPISDGPGSHDPGQLKAPRTPRCAGRRATIVGTPGRDTLRGTRRADVIVGLGGDDQVLARGGNDVVCGGAGDDRLSGGPGRDRLRGQQGRDRLTGGAGRDRCAGDSGGDRASGCERTSSL
jgi:uncharacterized delta-60 repeat protein